MPKLSLGGLLTRLGEVPLEDYHWTDVEILMDITRKVVRNQDPKGDLMDKPELAAKYLQLMYGGEECEYFGLIYLDNKHRVIGVNPRVFRGTVDAAVVHPREVVKDCLGMNAAAVICFHNHPSGCCEPSSSDHAITRRLVEVLKLVDIRLLDHLVISKTDWVSLAERGSL